MSRKLIEKNCKHCGSSFIGSKPQKFCNAECRTDFHNKQTSDRRHLPKYVLKRTLIYLANQQLLEKLYLGRIRSFSRQQLESFGFQFVGFVDLTFPQTTEQVWKYLLVLKYGKFELVCDPARNLFTIQIGKPVMT